MSDNYREGREFFRTEARLPVFWGPDTLAARQAMAMDTEMWDNQSQLESAARQVLEDGSVPESMRPLLTVMRWLDFKLDLILHHVRNREQAAHFPGRTFTTDLSGSGFGVAGPMDLEAGGRVLVSLALPDAPSRPIFALAEVVRAGAEELSHGAAAAVRFVDIAESDRERIIRYTFAQQRRLLAQRNQGD
ncbi:MAG: PilZ domain-containing protein [Pseudomonadota bacterium]